MEAKMSMATKVGQFLASHNIDFSLVKHRHTASSFNSALSAHVPTSQVAKAVILRDIGGDYLMAVVPANKHVLIGEINRQTGKQYYLLAEHELATLFQDCEPGAIPSLGQIYGMDMLVDDMLFEQDQLFMESGDHMNLINLDKRQFGKAMGSLPHSHISGYSFKEGPLFERRDL
ncbi:MAG: Ala-tRNA(Pro) deacylase [Moritella dasanensis]|jgi:Ala-tRNA(Pro) deacylase